MRLGSERSPLAESPNPGSLEPAPSVPPSEFGPLDPPALALASPPLLDAPPALEDPLELLLDDDPLPEFDAPLEPPLDDDDPLDPLLDDDDPPELPLDPELLDGGMDAEGEDGEDGALAEGQPESSGRSRPTASSSL